MDGFKPAGKGIVYKKYKPHSGEKFRVTLKREGDHISKGVHFFLRGEEIVWTLPDSTNYYNRAPCQFKTEEEFAKYAVDYVDWKKI